MNRSVIIVAGGKGLRVGGELPKQFIPLAGKPILMHTLEAFYKYDAKMNIVLVLPVSHQEYWKELCEKYQFVIPHQIANGGETRYHSVKNGLALISEGVVGVHDGVRCFVSQEVIARCYEAVMKHLAVIPVVDSADSLRMLAEDGSSQILDRSKIRLVQTPQVFMVNVLKKAYKGEFKETFTDDASVVEASGGEIHLVKGDVKNMKVTTPIDLKIGELILSEKI